MKKLVAYSSVSHLGFVVLGIFSFTQAGLDGAVYQMLNHGVSTGALFMLVGIVSMNAEHSLEIKSYGGVGTPAPNLTTIFVITSLASIGLPLLSNFVGEYLVLQGASKVSMVATVFAATGAIFAAVYMLWMVQRVFYGKADGNLHIHARPVDARVRRARADDRGHGLDGCLFADLPSRSQFGECRDTQNESAISRQRQSSNTPIPELEGARRCPLTTFHPTDEGILRILPEKSC